MFRLLSAPSLRLRPFSSASSSAELLLERLSGSDSGIAVLTLNRGPRKNALGRSMVSTLRSQMQSLAVDSSVRVVLLQSAVPGVFCAGADLKERAEMAPAEVSAFVSGLRACFSELESLPQPTIAVIDGAALGGGLELALACDFRVGGPKSFVGLPETSLAIIPGAGGTQRMTRLVGASRAKKLIFTAERLTGKEALEFGILDEFEEEESALEKALQLARRILPNGPIALRAAKMAIDKGKEVDLASGLAIEEMCYAQVIPTKDRLEGLMAFKEKRKPHYTGE